EKQLPIAYRNTIANMMAEAEALNGIFAQDEITEAWYRVKGLTDLPYPRLAPGAEASYEIDEAFSLDDVAPMIAKPYSPGNAFPEGKVGRDRTWSGTALPASCTRGRYEGLLPAGLGRRAARQHGFTHAEKTLAIFPGSGGDQRDIE